MKQIFTFLLITASAQAFSQIGEWTWMKGNNVPNSPAVFGTLGIGSPNNTPPALYGAAMWVDASNNIWLFGGVFYNTVWKYDIASNEWTWMKGVTANSASGAYGTMGVPSVTNTPGSRGYGFLSWEDLNGDFWVYGGDGYDAFGNEGLLSDLWKYSIATNEWTWMNGSNTAQPSASPDYGTFQVPSATNTPGGREETTANWVDSAGNLWFFGGFDNNIGLKDDVWKYDVALNQWVWMAGSSGTYAAPVYGTLGVPSPLNTPGGKNGYAAWKDLSGNFWLFAGGLLFDQTADLWKFNVTTLEWTWMGGSNVPNAPGVTGTPCVSDTSFYPASRSENRACWTDKCGNFWLYGGDRINHYGDLWAYRPDNDDWTYAGGSLNPNASTSYGTQGISSPSNTPGGRGGAPAVYDLSGNAWVFGGHIPGNNMGNDLWRFVPDTTCPALANCLALQVPSFIASDTELCQKFCIDFIDQSSNNPTAWQWIFPGGTPSSSTDQNPAQICYQVPGVYDVTLITTSASGNDTLTLFNYVTVNATPPFPTITQVGYTLTSSAASSYQWQLNSIDIPGATNQSYNVLQTGLYTVIVGDPNGCVNSESKYVLITGIDEVNDAGIFIYPNPSSGSFTIELLNQEIIGEVLIDVVNALGQKVFSSTDLIPSSHWKKEIDLCRDASSCIPGGVYFIEVKTANAGACPDFLGARKKILIAE